MCTQNWPNLQLHSKYVQTAAHNRLLLSSKFRLSSNFLPTSFFQANPIVWTAVLNLRLNIVKYQSVIIAVSPGESPFFINELNIHEN
jgi:hypothetical protein